MNVLQCGMDYLLDLFAENLASLNPGAPIIDDAFHFLGFILRRLHDESKATTSTVDPIFSIGLSDGSSLFIMSLPHTGEVNSLEDLICETMAASGKLWANCHIFWMDK